MLVLLGTIVILIGFCMISSGVHKEQNPDEEPTEETDTQEE